MWFASLVSFLGVMLIYKANAKLQMADHRLKTNWFIFILHIVSLTLLTLAMTIFLISSDGTFNPWQISFIYLEGFYYISLMVILWT
jgi:hypothetical protein